MTGWTYGSTFLVLVLLMFNFFLFPSFLVLCQAAKKIYESLLGDGVSATALAHIQVCVIVHSYF